MSLGRLDLPIFSLSSVVPADLSQVTPTYRRCVVPKVLVTVTRCVVVVVKVQYTRCLEDTPYEDSDKVYEFNRQISSDVADKLAPCVAES